MTSPADRMIDDLQAVVRDADALLQATASQAGDKIDGIRARATQSLHKARQRLAAVEQEAVHEVKQAATATDDYVRRNPWQAVGTAAGIGLLLGLLIGRR